MLRTREEHLTWCKQRALEYLNRGQLVDAVTSMMSDLDKHEETKQKPGSALSMLGVFTALEANKGNRESVRRYIEGFR